MRQPRITTLAGGLLLLATACAPNRTSSAEPVPAPAALERAARADSVRAHYTQADVDFMTGMIHHHAQALVMARMAPTHGAGEAVRTLAARIINGQNDEIRLMQRWLRERGEPVPEVAPDGTTGPSVRPHGGSAGHAGQGGGAAPGSMAGMLTPDQMARLDAARGAEWDRLFLQYMIQHHQGALVMVDELFATHGAGQGDATFKIASDIGADQATEIDRMQRMLQERLFGPGSP